MVRFIGLALIQLFVFSKVQGNCFQEFSEFLEPIVRSGKTFSQSIDHPDFLLWDNWGFIDRDGTQHVYAMAVSRNVPYADRIFYSHWRHFVSKDSGRTWEDFGVAFKPFGDLDDHASKAIWSGSVIRLNNGKYLAGYTGLSKKGEVLQSISLAISDDPQNFKPIYGKKSLLSHQNQRAQFLNRGYYVDEINHLGALEGEVNGSIQSLRDPFLVETDQGLRIFWSAKGYNAKGEVASAIGQAILEDLNDPSSLKILDPIFPPDSHEYTQIELPNVILRADGQIDWYISTSNRVSEAQDVSEVNFHVRKFTSSGFNAPLKVRGSSSIILDASESNTYGLNIMNNFQTGQAEFARVFHVHELLLPASLKLSNF